jgi:hypothetical protein
MSFSRPAYQRLTPAQQLFVVVDLERTERGLPPAVVLSKSLSAVAQAGAQAGRDPAMGSTPRRLPGGGLVAYAGATWSGGWVNALGADYEWMYDDGPGGSNLACRTGSPRYCWGHRDVLLTSFGPRSCHGYRARGPGGGLRRERRRADDRGVRPRPLRRHLHLGQGQEAARHPLASYRDQLS